VKRYKENVLCRAQTLKVNFKISCGFREQSNYLGIYGPRLGNSLSPNFSKQSPAFCLTGPTEFRKNRNFIWREQNRLHVCPIQKWMNLSIWLVRFLCLGSPEFSLISNKHGVSEKFGKFSEFEKKR
jgi:hypothetical protein